MAAAAAPGAEALPRRDPPGLALRMIAAQHLDRVLRGAAFEPIDARALPDGRDRALANRLVTTALRRHGHLDVVLGELLERGLPRKAGLFEAAVRLALTQVLFLPGDDDHSALFLAVEQLKRDTRSQHVARLANAVLRRAQSEAARFSALPPEALLPGPLRNRWIAHWGTEAVDGFAATLLETPPLDLTLARPDADLAAALGGVALPGNTVRILDRDRPVESLPGYAEGRWWVQDVAAAIPARLIDAPAGARVLDLCAAPGGKTAQLVAAGYRVTALDNDPARLDRLRANLSRLGMTAEIVCEDAATYRPAEAFDAILLDAPCSATGTFRRHPEVIWHRDAADIAGRVALQRRLLAHAAQCLNPGGVLVYCVCSLETPEGEEQGEWLETAGLGLVRDRVRPEEVGLDGVVDALGAVRTHPGVPLAVRGGMDGFYAVRLRKP